MDEVWDDDYSPSVQPVQSAFGSEVVDRGTGYGRGRGLSIPKDDEGYSPSGFKSYGGHDNENGCGDSSNNNFGRSSFQSRGSRGSRGGDRGSRGSRGGRGSFGGYRGRDNDDDAGDRENGDGGYGGSRGSRGGRGSFGGFRGRDNDDDAGDRENGDGGYGGGGGDDNYRGSGRGRRGGGRGRGDRDDAAPGMGDGADEKPREIYIPPEPSNDENEIFGSGITSGNNFNKYDNIQVKVSGENSPKKIESFAESGLKQLLLNNIVKCHYLKPTPVQKNAIPIIMAGRDLMACAQTGSGKTAAFLLPIIHNILENPVVEDTDEDAGYNASVKPIAVIVSPTRELSIQIYKESMKFAHSSIVRSCVVYGGTSTSHQINVVRRGCHVLVATPGRLQDMVDKGVIAFSAVRFFVLDEADRMLDMGFLPAVEKILLHPSMVQTGERQTLMFSATFPEEIQKLAVKFLRDYLFLAVGIVGGACSDVEQTFYEVPKFDKRKKLLEMLQHNPECERTLVFVEQKRLADFIAAFLSEQKFPTTSIHGDRLQSQREGALADFKNGTMHILVATAVAARGLDIKDVAHVVNFDLPKSIDEYVHRIGRTGRVGNRGKATSFYDPEQDAALARDLVKILEQAEQYVPPWLKAAASSGGGSASGYSQGKFGGRDFRKFEQSESYSQPQPVQGEDEESWSE